MHIFNSNISWKVKVYNNDVSRYSSKPEKMDGEMEQKGF